MILYYSFKGICYSRFSAREVALPLGRLIGYRIQHFTIMLCTALHYPLLAINRQVVCIPYKGGVGKAVTLFRRVWMYYAILILWAIGIDKVLVAQGCILARESVLLDLCCNKARSCNSSVNWIHTSSGESGVVKTGLMVMSCVLL